MIYQLKNQLYLVLQVSGNTLIELLPYVVLGVILGELLKRSSWITIIHNACLQSPLLSVISASLLGMVSPLCTYGTVPIVLLLLSRGVPIAPLVTFLAVSSLMNPQLFIITWGGINPEMALVQGAAVFVYGILSGLTLYKLPGKSVVNPNTIGNDEEMICTGNKQKTGWKIFIRNSWMSFRFVGFYIIAGIIIGSLIEVFVPPGWIDAVFSSNKHTSVLIGALLGVPLYACGGGAVPLVDSLMSMGMSKGAALSFFIVGPATRITPLMALAAVLRPLFIIVYIIVLIVYAVTVGIMYN